MRTEGNNSFEKDIMVLLYCSGRDRMVVGFTTTYAINAYHH